MADDFRPHLLITEDDVEAIENKKQARNKDLGLDRMKHGTKLSTGLQEIVSAYTRIQGTDSLRDEDIRLFEVVLQEGEKFSNKTLREFLEQEGMTRNIEKGSICIGQGFRKKTGKLGVGSCTKNFDRCQKGCPPSAEKIYSFLKKEYQKV